MCFERLAAALAAVVAAMSWTSCSVKEDRSECPRAVILDMSGLDAGVLSDAGCGRVDAGLFEADPPGALSAASGSVRLEELPAEYALYASRRPLRLYALCVPEDVETMEGAVMIAAGEQCPVLYAFYADVPPGDDVTVPVRMSKEFCRMEIVFVDGVPEGSKCMVTGQVNGYDAGGNAMGGVFRRALTPGVDGRCEVLLPRQTDDSLRLVVDDGGDIIRVFAIGIYLIRAGYDWNAVDLGDVSVSISFVRSTVTFSSGLWQKTVVMDIVF